jgi:hypothetical protein
VKDGDARAFALIRRHYTYHPYRDGRVTWNAKRLEEYMETHPEVKKFRKVGKPYITIANIEGKAKSEASEEEE